MGKEYEENVVGKKPAPACMVVFRCPTCEGVAVLNAYMGVPTCGCVPTNSFMVPTTLMREPTVDHNVDGVGYLTLAVPVQDWSQDGA